MIRGNGKTIIWLRANARHEGDNCLTWPFSIDPQNGYGRLGYLGKMYWAHRLMCELAHGVPTTTKHEVAHSCGRGHEGCVNPRHLSWKTRSENQRERRLHGTHGKGDGPRCRLTPEQASEIRQLRGIKTQAELAAIYGVSWQNIGMIQRGETWRPDTYRVASLTREQVASIWAQRGTKKARDIATQHGVKTAVIYRIYEGRSFARYRPGTEDEVTNSER